MTSTSSAGISRTGSSTTLPWDRAITNVAIAARIPTRDDLPPNVSLPGSTKVVAVLSAALALLATRRSPRIAVVIIIVAIARPLSEFALKEIYGRDRPLAVTPAPIGNAQQFTATAA
jgi:hypothetical protein